MSLRIQREGAAVVLTVDRPETKNAIDRALAENLGFAVREASADESVRGIVLTGSGSEIFLSGGDLKEFSSFMGKAGSGNEVLAMFDRVAIIETCAIPVIAAVQGDAFGGGCELLLLTDMTIAEEHATLSFRHAKMGLSPAWGGTARLLERVGPIEAAKVLFTSERVTAQEALRIGLVNEVVAKGASLARALELIERIAKNARGTVEALKRGLYRTREKSRAGASEIEREIFLERWGGPDHAAAVAAFMGRKSR